MSDITSIKALVRSVSSDLTPLIQPVVDFDKFIYWPGSSGKHHCFYGGLARHTREVLEIALGTGIAASNTKPIDLNVLAIAAVWHDVGKLFDYEVELKDDNEIEVKYVAHARRIGHISRSYLEFTNFFQKGDWIGHFGGKFMEDVQHCIISHHGRKEWGSSREPQTIEALILHQADTISAMLSSDVNPQMR